MNVLLAQEQPAPPAGAPADSQQGGAMGFLIPILLMWLVIWFVVLRPQRKQEKERQARVGGLKKGDRVRTRGGVVAPVVRIKDDEVVLGLAGDGRAEMVVMKAYIEEVFPGAGKNGAEDAK